MTEVEGSIFKSWSETESPYFESQLKNLFKTCDFENSILTPHDKALKQGALELGDAIKYSLFTGGKRFRPLIVFASCQALKQDFKLTCPWALAIECVHTYSLIHDDLPCMDDDDERRGRPTVHKKFSESTALLAGDALLTEAFGILGQFYSSHRNLGELLKLLSQRAGYQGMVSGQANDLFVSELNQLSKEQVLYIHLQKTAALISAASVGPFLIFESDKVIIEKMNFLSLVLGILFQLKDDILDSKIKIENNVVQSLGLEESETIFNSFKESANQIIADLQLNSNLEMKSYQELLEYNENRSY